MRVRLMMVVLLTWLSGHVQAADLPRILVYGDSNTWGWVPVAEAFPTTRHAADNRWPEVMRRALGNVDVVAAGLRTAATPRFHKEGEHPMPNPTVIASGIRPEAGLERIEQLLGRDSRVSMQQLAATAPMSARAGAIAVGEIYREEALLDLKTRELVTVAVLAARGDAMPQLRVHLGGAINAGASREEIFAVLDQLHPYTGLPVALNAMRVAREHFQMIGEQP